MMCTLWSEVGRTDLTLLTQPARPCVVCMRWSAHISVVVLYRIPLSAREYCAALQAHTPFTQTGTLNQSHFVFIPVLRRFFLFV
jgi:hypothetical protein